jgi:hypothetical protein
MPRCKEPRTRGDREIPGKLSGNFLVMDLADDLRLQVHRQGPAVTCPQILQTVTPPFARRLAAEHSLGGEQPFDTVDVPHPVAHQRPALAADASAALLLRRRALAIERPRVSLRL